MKQTKCIPKNLICLFFLLALIHISFAQKPQSAEIQAKKKLMYRSTKRENTLRIKKIIPSVKNDIVEIIIVFDQLFNPFEINRDILLINNAPLPEDASVKYNKQGNEMTVLFDILTVKNYQPERKSSRVQRSPNSADGAFNVKSAEKKDPVRFFLSILGTPENAMSHCQKMSFEIFCGDTIFFNDFE
ncbi:MAG: hypothetical protein ACRC4W_07625 [Treponemataceae bacterium]